MAQCVEKKTKLCRQSLISLFGKYSNELHGESYRQNAERIVNLIEESVSKIGKVLISSVSNEKFKKSISNGVLSFKSLFFEFYSQNRISNDHLIQPSNLTSFVGSTFDDSPAMYSLENLRGNWVSNFNKSLAEKSKRKIVETNINRISSEKVIQRITKRNIEIDEEESFLKMRREKHNAEKKSYFENLRIYKMLIQAQLKGHMVIDLLAFGPNDSISLRNNLGMCGSMLSRVALESEPNAIIEEDEEIDAEAAVSQFQSQSLMNFVATGLIPASFLESQFMKEKFEGPDSLVSVDLPSEEIIEIQTPVKGKMKRLKRRK